MPYSVLLEQTLLKMRLLLAEKERYMPLRLFEQVLLDMVLLFAPLIPIPYLFEQ